MMYLTIPDPITSDFDRIVRPAFGVGPASDVNEIARRAFGVGPASDVNRITRRAFGVGPVRAEAEPGQIEIGTKELVAS
jgi:hypothetical protein